ncbi:MAG: hypothetical protein KA715_14650 [Xanthomonadaceae bacterium]|nr:hypothetical protein [Xanthomonadaceae bacterium]
MLGLWLAISVISQNSFAGSESFGGSCASQGGWTARALQQTQEITEVINNLRDDPACQGFLNKGEHAHKIFQDLENSLKETQQGFGGGEGAPQAGDESRQSWETLPKELADLRAFFATNKSTQGSFWDVFMNKTIESATGGGGGSVLGLNESYKALTKRVSRSSITGLQGLNRVLTAIPSLEECIIGAPDVGARLFSTVVDMAASFASSDPGAASEVGNTIRHIVNIMRERRYTEIIRRIKKAQFINSVSCLLESTTHVYCTTNESIELFKMGMDEKWARKKSQETSSPLEGYFILNREVKVVTDWITKVNRGIDPQWKTDSAFKNEAIRSVSIFLETHMNVLGQFNEGWFNARNAKNSIEEQRNFLYKAIRELVEEIAEDTQGSINFFTSGTNPKLIPYYLVGYDAIPRGAFVTTGGLMNWEEYFQSYGSKGGFIEPFNDPTKLAGIIRERLENLAYRARLAAIKYYVERVIVDHSVLVTEALTPSTLVNLTVLESLEHINAYLEKLKIQVLHANGDNLMFHSLEDTINRIQRIQNAFKTVRADEIDSVSDSKQFLAKFKTIIETVYLEFNMLLQRESLVVNRLANFVAYDYSLKVKSGENMSQFQKELMIVSGREIMDRIQSVYEKDPAKVQQDLSNAQVMINLPNLRSIEDLFGDMFFSVLEEFKVWDENPRATYLNVKSKQLARKAKDSNMGAWSILKKLLMEGSSNSERYGFGDDWEGQPLGGDEQENVHTVRSKLCIQSLAFERGHRYAEFCKGITLKGIKDPSDSRSIEKLDLNSNYDAILASSKLPENQKYSWLGVPGHEYAADKERRCAFRNYLRKNQVYWMTQKINSAK